MIKALKSHTILVILTSAHHAWSVGVQCLPLFLFLWYRRDQQPQLPLAGSLYSPGLLARYVAGS